MHSTEHLEYAVLLLTNLYHYCEKYDVDLEHAEDAAYLLFQENMESENVNRLAA